MGTNFADGVVDEALQLVRVGVGVAVFDILHGAMKNAPTDGLFDEFGEVAFFGALGTEKGAKGEIGFFRDFDVPANGFLFHESTYTPRQINT